MMFDTVNSLCVVFFCCYSRLLLFDEKEKVLGVGGAVLHSGGGMGGSKGWFVGVGQGVSHRGGGRGVS